MSGTTRDAIEKALLDAFVAEGEMISKWVVLAEGMDRDGKTGLWVFSPRGQQAWDSIGMLKYAEQLELAVTVRKEMEA